MAVKGNIPDIGKPLVLKLQKDLARETEDRQRSDRELEKKIDDEIDERKEADGAFSEALTAQEAVIVENVTVPRSGWTEDGGGFKCDVKLEKAGERLFPTVALHEESMSVAAEAEVSPAAETLEGAVRLRAKNRPAGDMTATVKLTPGKAAGE